MQKKLCQLCRHMLMSCIFHMRMTEDSGILEKAVTFEEPINNMGMEIIKIGTQILECFGDLLWL